MPIDSILSVVLLSFLIWGLRFLLPKAIKERDRLALTAAVLTILIALLAWALTGVSVR